MREGKQESVPAADVIGPFPVGHSQECAGRFLVRQAVAIRSGGADCHGVVRI